MSGWGNGDPGDRDTCADGIFQELDYRMKLDAAEFKESMRPWFRRRAARYPTQPGPRVIVTGGTGGIWTS